MRSCLVLGTLVARVAAVSTATRSIAVRLPGLDHPVQTLEVLDPDELLESQPLADDDCDVYGACLWPSSFIVARNLVRHLVSSDAPAPRVVELGCGAAALPSLAALAAGAERVVATDWSPLALSLAADAAKSYQPTRVHRLDTRRFDVKDPEWAFGRCDFIVCSDMLYEEQAACAVGACVAKAVRDGATAIVADPGRLGGSGRVHFLAGLSSELGDVA
eukprot:3632553-Prymnesium_polylepis.1